MNLHEELFADSVLLAFDVNKTPIFLKDNKIMYNSEVKFTLEDSFLGIVSLKKTPFFLILDLDEKNLYIKTYDYNFNLYEKSIFSITDYHIEEIYDVFMDQNENNIYIIFSSTDNIYCKVKVSGQSIEVKNEVVQIDHDIELIIDEEIYLVCSMRPGYGKIAKVINDSGVLSVLNRYLSYYSSYVLYISEHEKYETLILKNIISNKVEFKIEYHTPIISAYIISPDYLVVLSNKKGRIGVDIINFKDKDCEIYSNVYECFIEIQSINNNHLTFKSSSLKYGIRFGYIDKNGVHFISCIGEVNTEVKTYFFREHFPVMTYEPTNKKINKIIFSLHGGPESYEFNELRYSGIYKDALDNGSVVCVLNYTGSAYQMYYERKSSWKNWDLVIKNILYIIKKYTNKYNLENSDIIIMGASFGATLALLSASNINSVLNKVIAIAPLMNLENHLTKVSRDEYKWFIQRFSNTEIRDLFKWNNFINKIKSPVHIIQGDKDNILNFDDTISAIRYAEKNNLYWQLWVEENGGHAPDNEFESQRRYYLLKKLL